MPLGIMLVLERGWGPNAFEPGCKTPDAVFSSPRLSAPATRSLSEPDEQSVAGADHRLIPIEDRAGDDLR